MEGKEQIKSIKLGLQVFIPMRCNYYVQATHARYKVHLVYTTQLLQANIDSQQFQPTLFIGHNLSNNLGSDAII